MCNEGLYTDCRLPYALAGGIGPYGLYPCPPGYSGLWDVGLAVFVVDGGVSAKRRRRLLP
jgi:hypothetical protein